MCDACWYGVEGPSRHLLFSRTEHEFVYVVMTISVLPTDLLEWDKARDLKQPLLYRSHILSYLSSIYMLLQWFEFDRVHLDL